MSRGGVGGVSGGRGSAVPSVASSHENLAGDQTLNPLGLAG